MWTFAFNPLSVVICFLPALILVNSSPVVPENPVQVVFKDRNPIPPSHPGVPGVVLYKRSLQQATGNFALRFRRNTNLVSGNPSLNLANRQIATLPLDVPLTPIIDASHPHTEACTLSLCSAKCIQHDLGTCIPQCVNYACYCKCPNPDKPMENFTPSPVVQLVPDLQFETPIDYIRPPTSPPIGNFNPNFRPGPAFANQNNQFGSFPNAVGAPGGQSQFVQ